MVKTNKKTIKQIPILRTGLWKNNRFIKEDLDSMVNFYEDQKEVSTPRIIFTHSNWLSDKYISAIESLSLGSVENLCVRPSKRKNKKEDEYELVCDLTDMPLVLYNMIINKNIQNLSVEIMRADVFEEKFYAASLRAVAVLGRDFPAVKSLQDFSKLLGFTDKSDNLSLSIHDIEESNLISFNEFDILNEEKEINQKEENNMTISKEELANLTKDITENITENITNVLTSKFQEDLDVNTKKIKEDLEGQFKASLDSIESISRANVETQLNNLSEAGKLPPAALNHFKALAFSLIADNNILKFSEAESNKEISGKPLAFLLSALDAYPSNFAELGNTGKEGFNNSKTTVFTFKYEDKEYILSEPEVESLKEKNSFEEIQMIFANKIKPVDQFSQAMELANSEDFVKFANDTLVKIQIL